MSSPHDATEPRRTARQDGWPQFAIECVIERDQDGVDQCTVHPRDASSEELLDTWISAEEGSFVGIAETR